MEIITSCWSRGRRGRPITDENLEILLRATERFGNSENERIISKVFGRAVDLRCEVGVEDEIEVPTGEGCGRDFGCGELVSVTR